MTRVLNVKECTCVVEIIFAYKSKAVLIQLFRSLHIPRRIRKRFWKINHNCGKGIKVKKRKYKQ